MASRLGIAAVLVAALVIAFARPAEASVSCGAQAHKVSQWGSAMLVHYDGVTVYPADVSYLLLRGALTNFSRRHCSLRVLGTTLRRDLKPAQRERLLELLPRSVERTLRRALAAARPT